MQPANDLKYANVMGLQKDLNMGGNDFSNTATFLFVALLCFEIPNSKQPLHLVLLTRHHNYCIFHN